MRTDLKVNTVHCTNSCFCVGHYSPGAVRSYLRTQLLACNDVEAVHWATGQIVTIYQIDRDLDNDYLDRNRVELGEISMTDDGFADGMARRRGRRVRVRAKTVSVGILYL